MSSYSLRNGWKFAPYSPINDIGYETEVRWFRTPDSTEKVVIGAMSSLEVAKRRLRPLSKGVVASSAAGYRHRTLLTSLRTTLCSFEWPARYVDGERIWFGEGDVPTVKDARGKGPKSTGQTDYEAQGVAFDGGRVFLVCTDTIWAISLNPGVPPIADPQTSAAPALDLAIGGPRDKLLVFEKAKARFSGRFQVTQQMPRGPVHLSAPFAYGGRLFVPAEGVPFDLGDERGLPREDRRADWDSTLTYQWLYVYDVSNIGYVGRIGLPASLPASEVGLNAHITACSFDPVSQRIYAVRYGDDRPVNEIYVFQMPDLAQLAPSGSTLETERVVSRYPTLAADFVAMLPLSGIDGGPVNLGRVNGIAVSPSGRIFVGFMLSNGVPPPQSVWDPKSKHIMSKDFAVLGFDPVTGRAVRYHSLDYIDAFLTFFRQTQGLSVDDEKISVLVWMDGLSSTFDIRTIYPAGGGLP
ncbi:MAG: hypothetical protein IPJ34_05590 [Myxococcales bacterium]|nr:hypothetical protein [Myxococcales bacterium]